MSMSFSICAKCGSRKPGYDVVCSKCGFKPVLEDDVAVGLILSSDFKMDALELPKTDDELRYLSQRIASGEPLNIDQAQVDAVKDFARTMQVFHERWGLQSVLLWWVVPALLLLGMVAYLFTSILRT